MKTDGILVAAVVAVGAFLMLRGGSAGALPMLQNFPRQVAGLFQAPVANTPSYTASGGAGDAVNQIINSALPGQIGYGWDYFSNGTVIDPQGNYYFMGKKVWSAPKAA